MICDRWSVIAVPFPFLERPATKRRPAVVLTPKDFNSLNGHSILAMVTTAQHSVWPSDHKILDLGKAGLPVPSIIRWKVFTLPNEIIEKQLGELGQEDKTAVEAAARHLFSE